MASATFDITPATVARRLNRRLLRAREAPELTRELIADWLLAHDALSDHNLFLIGALCATADMASDKADD
jgi:hypothetical protein